jgi:hypothetical protein
MLYRKRFYSRAKAHIIRICMYVRVCLVVCKISLKTLSKHVVTEQSQGGISRLISRKFTRLSAGTVRMNACKYPRVLAPGFWNFYILSLRLDYLPGGTSL